MASPSESGSRGNLDISLKCIPKSPSVSEWLALVDEARVALYGSPSEPSADLGRAAAVLIQAHLRHRAPIAAIWQQLHTEEWTEAVRAVEQLAPRVRWAVGAAAGAWFARNGNEAGFDVAARILKAFRFPVVQWEEIAHGALLVCIEHRPVLLGELMRNGVLKRATPLEYLARTRPAALVGEVFSGVEEACCECEPESHVGTAVWRTRRWDVALACLSLVRHDIVNSGRPNTRKQTAGERRDHLRRVAAQALAKDGRLEQATELLLESENHERGIYQAISLLCNFDSPDVAFDLWKGSAYCREDSFLARDIALAFAEQGRVANALEVAAQASGTKSDRNEIVVSALTHGLKTGAVNEVAGALDQVSSKRDRAKLEEAVSRAGGAIEPKELRARAEALARRATTAKTAAAAATQIALLLPDTKASDAIFIRAALVRALTKADLHEAVDEHLSAALAGVRGVSRKKVRNEAAEAVFAAAVASGRFADGLVLLEHVTEDFNDHDEIREYLFEVVETCKDAGVIEQLKASLPAGSEVWVVEQFNEILTWQGVSEGKVDQLVKKAMKRPRVADRDYALSEIVRDLEARKQYPEALAVLHRITEPHSPSADRIGLARRAAEDGFPRVAEAILDIVETGWRAKAEGRSRQESTSAETQRWQQVREQAIQLAEIRDEALASLLRNSAEEVEQLKGSPTDRREWQQVRERAFEVRSAFELAHGDEDALVSLSEGMLNPVDQRVLEVAQDWINKADLDLNPASNPQGTHQGRTLFEGAGSLDAAIARELQEDRKTVAPGDLIELARYAATQDSLRPRVPEVLAHALRCLRFAEEYTSYRPREEMAAIARFVIHGLPIPEFSAKAEELMAAIANGYFLGADHLAIVLAAMGRWPEAFETLDRILLISEYGLARESRAATACHLLLTAPLETVRAHASVFSDHLELAWVYTAALAVRGGEQRKPGPLKRLLKRGGDRSEFLVLLQESDQLLQIRLS